MKLLGKKPLHDFRERYLDAKNRAEAWESEIEDASWRNPHEMKQRFPTADPIGGKNTIFNIGKYRLWAVIDYESQIVLIKKVGTHAEYDEWKII